MTKRTKNKKAPSVRERLFEIIFEADTRAGRIFDVVLIVSILISVIVVFLDSVKEIHDRHGGVLYSLEWFFTLLFSLEYILRIYCTRKPRKYVFSFYGLVDFLGIIPTYFSVLFPGSQYLFVIRILRVQRIFRVLKLVQFLDELQLIGRVIRNSWRKITVFLTLVLIITVIIGSMMYIIEGEENGFTNIPRGIYWAIVTMTTVGYGDISPQTGWGQALAALLIILGYSIIVVPTGIVSVEMTQGKAVEFSTQRCPDCHKDGHDQDASFCKFCGQKL